MVYYVAYDEELRIWWDARYDKAEGMRYKLTVDGRNCVYTNNIYYNFKNLEGGQEYSFDIQVVDQEDRVIGKTEHLVCSTLPKRKRVDITKAPYHAIGDGRTDNTEAIQRALKDCPSGCELYVPMGVYLCNQVSFSGDINIRFDVGARFVSKRGS